ncbi:MAG: hypothetical protein CR985_03940 [Flavobacteriales bacterium]|nr:MAG: hypothetical protein CR985_03940 [Flavobacteriales bacterium]
MLKVKDKSHKGKKRTFDISERSKGFQWFFNYMVKLKFNPNYKEHQKEFCESLSAKTKKNFNLINKLKRDVKLCHTTWCISNSEPVT